MRLTTRWAGAEHPTSPNPPSRPEGGRYPCWQRRLSLFVCLKSHSWWAVGPEVSSAPVWDSGSSPEETATPDSMLSLLEALVR